MVNHQFSLNQSTIIEIIDIGASIIVIKKINGLKRMVTERLSHLLSTLSNGTFNSSKKDLFFNEETS